MEQSVTSEEVDGFCMVELQFLFDDHYQFKNGESFEYEDSICRKMYLLLSNSLSLLCLILLRRIGILSGWNLRIISAYCLLSEPYIIIKSIINADL